MERLDAMRPWVASLLGEPRLREFDWIPNARRARQCKCLCLQIFDAENMNAEKLGLVLFYGNLSANSTE